MRGVRWLLLLAISALLVTVGSSYYLQKSRQAREAPPPPPELPDNVAATGDTWIHTIYDGKKPVAELRAVKMRQIREPSAFDLEGVELRIFHEDTYDRVRSARAQFDIRKGGLFSEGDVEITLAVPRDSDIPESGLVVIETSALDYDTESGRATTDQPTRFRFSRGKGSSTGATYEPQWGDLTMHADVRLEWYGHSPDTSMIVEAGELTYKEQDSLIYLSPWSRFTRGSLTLEAGESVVRVADGTLQQVDAQNAHGTDREEQREIQYLAAHLVMYFTPETLIEKIVGEGGARLTSQTTTAETEVTAEKLFLEFKPADGESLLDHALAMGDGRLALLPRSETSAGVPPDRILESQTIKALLNPDGETINRIETHDVGSVEFLPNSPEQRHRRLVGGRITMHYGAGNRLESFRASQARTWTAGRPLDDDESAPPAVTSSADLLATFNPDSGVAVRLEQWGDFQYEEGDRRAKADRAAFDILNDIIQLDGKARVWDPSGSTAAEQVILNQSSGIFQATGRVASTRVPEVGKGGGMLGGDEMLHATAETMAATADGAFVAYEGDAVLWQGPDRLRADRVEIDRKGRTLSARGEVVSRFLSPQEKPSGDDTDAPEAFTLVTANTLVYTEEHRSAHYAGGVHLSRPGLDITSAQLKAFFHRDTDGEPVTRPALHHALAQGEVRIIKEDQARKTVFTGEDAQYYVEEEKIVLSGGRPKMVDSVRGVTQGGKLTYFAADDRLLVDGEDSRPAVSHLQRGGSE